MLKFIFKSEDSLILDDLRTKLNQTEKARVLRAKLKSLHELSIRSDFGLKTDTISSAEKLNGGIAFESAAIHEVAF